MKSYTMNESLKSAIEALKSQEMMVAHYTSPSGWWTGIVEDGGKYTATQVFSNSCPSNMILGMQTHDIGHYDLSDITIDRDPDHMRYMVDGVEYDDELEAWKAWLEDRPEFVWEWEDEIDDLVESAVREGVIEA